MYLEMWSAISALRRTREPLWFWRRALGADFEKAEPFLAACEGVAGTHVPCPDTGIRLEIRKRRDAYRAFPAGEHAEDAEDRDLTWSEAQAWRIDGGRLREGLCEALGLAGAAEGDGEAAEVEMVGVCERSGVRRRVYLCHATDAESAARLAADAGRTPDAGCILFPERYLAAEHVLKGRGVAGVVLGECLTWAEGRWAGGCGKSCQGVEKGGSGAEALDAIRDEISAVARQKREMAEENADRQATIGEMAKGADRFLAGLQAQLTKSERDVFFLLIARVRDGDRIRVMSYAEIGKRLGKITKQAVRRRAARMYARHASMKAFVEAERKRKADDLFSEMSPADREEHGIEKSYGYKAR